MNKIKKYFSLALNKEETEANIDIYGDITSWEWFESDVSSYTLSKKLETLPDTVKNINVYINSYGGEVSEGLAIYNALKRHKAKVTTYCDGFACSIASVIFMAGDERIMSTASLLMIHNAWLEYASGNANQLRKQADDLDVITQASINAYMSCVNIKEEELKAMLDSEKWLEYKEALEKGFATSVVSEQSDSKAVNQSAKKMIIAKLLAQLENPEDDDKEDDDNNEDNNNEDDKINNLDDEENTDNNEDEENADNEETNTDEEDEEIDINKDEEETDEKDNEEDNKNKENQKIDTKVFEKFLKIIGGI